MVVADGEIVALDQQEAEIARQRRVLEIGLAEAARRQHADPRLVAIGARTKTISKRLEERRDARDVHRLVEIGEGAREHQAVLQRIARARRRLRAVAEHPPAAVGSAADVGGIEREIAPAGRLHAADGTKIFGTAGDRGGRQRAFGDEPALAIDVAQHELEQLGALGDAVGQLLPIRLVDQQRQMADRPRPVGALAGRSIGDAGLAQMSVGHAKPPLDLVGRERAEGVEEPAPDRARGAVGPQEFVGDAGQAAIVADPLREAALALTLALRPTRLVVLFRCALGHAPLPAPASYSLQERGPQVEGQRKLTCAFFGRRLHRPRRVAMVLEARQPPRLGLIGVDGLGVVAAAAGMGDVIDAATERAAIPGVDEVEGQRRVHRNGRMQARRPAARP
ncbi:hypothetical protein ACVWW5_005743 [Bradyrhizobium sp. LM3.4]